MSVEMLVTMQASIGGIARAASFGERQWRVERAAFCFGVGCEAFREQVKRFEFCTFV
jgi:hypothetical protein